MIIEINSEYRITSNPTCWQVEKRKPDRKDGSERWEPLTYHVDFKSALVSLAEYRIRNIADRATVDETKEVLREIKQDARKALELFSK